METYFLTLFPSIDESLRALKMSDESEAPIEDEASMYTFQSSMMWDGLLQVTNEVIRFDELDLQERNQLREVNADEISVLTLNTTTMSKVLIEPRNNTEEMEDMSHFDSANSSKRTRLKEVIPEVRNTLKARVQAKYKRYREKYNCGKCGKKKKFHICEVDQLRAGRWSKHNVWTQIPTKFRVDRGMI
jgi:hypothetical protein